MDKATRKEIVAVLLQQNRRDLARVFAAPKAGPVVNEVNRMHQLYVKVRDRAASNKGGAWDEVNQLLKKISFPMDQLSKAVDAL